MIAKKLLWLNIWLMRNLAIQSNVFGPNMHVIKIANVFRTILKAWIWLHLYCMAWSKTC